jgi:phage gpG-like protein
MRWENRFSNLQDQVQRQQQSSGIPNWLQNTIAQIGTNMATQSIMNGVFGKQATTEQVLPAVVGTVVGEAAKGAVGGAVTGGNTCSVVACLPKTPFMMDWVAMFVPI